MAWRAATSTLHWSLLCASLLSDAQECRHSLISPSTVLLQVCFGLPCLLFPSGVQCSATLGIESCGILRTCPIHLHLLPGDQSFHALSSAPLKKVVVRNSVGPEDAQYPPQTCSMECWWIICISLCHVPTFTSVHQGRQYAAVVNFQFYLVGILRGSPDVVQHFHDVPSFVSLFLMSSSASPSFLTILPK